MPVSALQIFMEEGVPLCPPVIDRTVRRSTDELVFMDRRMGEVSVLSREVWDPPIQSEIIAWWHRMVLPVVFRQFGECGE